MLYHEDISKNKGIKSNFDKSCKNFKTVDGHLTYKGKRRAIFFNVRKLLIPQYHSILPYSDTYLRSLNCKQSKQFKCF